MSIEQYTGNDVLDIMAKYAPNRNASIARLISRYLKLDELPKHSRVLEFGAGKGEFIKRFVPKRNLELLAVESDLSYIINLSMAVEVFATIEEVPGELDAIYLIDTLEHLENDQFYLNQFYKKLKSNGRIFIYVPARKELYSSFDKKIGHFRRYTKRELKGKVVEAGFSVEKIRYHEVLGYFASLLNKMFSKSPDLNIRAVRLYDNILVPATNFIERIIPVPIGKSIYLSAIRKN